MLPTALPPFRWMGQVTTVNAWLTTYYFDLAVTQFGNHIESELLKRDKEGKAVTSLERLIESDEARQKKRLPIRLLMQGLA